MQMKLPTLDLGSTCSPCSWIQSEGCAAGRQQRGDFKATSGAFWALGQREVRSLQVCAMLPLLEEPVLASLANLHLVAFCGWEGVIFNLGG